MKPGKLNRIISNSKIVSEGPSPEAYNLPSEFSKSSKGAAIQPALVNKEKPILKDLLGPCSYTPKLSLLVKNIMHSFPKTGREDIGKDKYPRVSPVNYSVNGFGNKSTYETNPKFSFGKSARQIDATMWDTERLRKK